MFYVVNLKDDSTYAMVIKFERFYVEYVPENVSISPLWATVFVSFFFATFHCILFFSCV